MSNQKKNFIKGMTDIGKIAAQVLQTTSKYAAPGITLNELDQIAKDVILSHGVESACIGYKGYPKYTCISVNDVLCHGLPDDSKLKHGDVVNIDITVKDKEGFHGDTSLSLVVEDFLFKAPATDLPPNSSCEDIFRRKVLVSLAKQARDAGISAIRSGARTGDIGYLTSNFVFKNKNIVSVVPEIGGHGIGKKFHMEPFIPAVGRWGFGEVLKPWTCITVEPILTLGRPSFIAEEIPGSQIEVYRTTDGMPAAQFEHTILVTDTGFEILTEF